MGDSTKGNNVTNYSPVFKHITQLVFGLYPIKRIQYMLYSVCTQSKVYHTHCVLFVPNQKDHAHCVLFVPNQQDVTHIVFCLYPIKRISHTLCSFVPNYKDITHVVFCLYPIKRISHTLCSVCTQSKGCHTRCVLFVPN